MPEFPAFKQITIATLLNDGDDRPTRAAAYSHPGPTCTTQSSPSGLLQFNDISNVRPADGPSRVKADPSPRFRGRCLSEAKKDQITFVPAARSGGPRRDTHVPAVVPLSSSGSNTIDISRGLNFKPGGKRPRSSEPEPQPGNGKRVRIKLEPGLTAVAPDDEVTGDFSHDAATLDDGPTSNRSVEASRGQQISAFLPAPPVETAADDFQCRDACCTSRPFARAKFFTGYSIRHLVNLAGDSEGRRFVVAVVRRRRYGMRNVRVPVTAGVDDDGQLNFKILSVDMSGKKLPRAYLRLKAPISHRQLSNANAILLGRFAKAPLASLHAFAVAYSQRSVRGDGSKDLSGLPGRDMSPAIDK